MSIVIFLFLAVKIRLTKLQNILGILISILLILFLTLGFSNLNLFDYAQYAGTVNDLILGKPLLTARTSYGFLPVFFLSLIFHFIPLSSQVFAFEVVVVNSIGFILFYLLCLKIFKDIRWALVTTLTAIFVSHLAFYQLVYQIPQYTMIRMGFWIFIAFSIAFKLKLFTPVITAAVYFMVPDFGLYTFLAYPLYLLIHFVIWAVKTLKEK